MNDLEGAILAGAIIAVFLALLYALFYKYPKAERMERFGLSHWGPFLLWKTSRGRGILARIAGHTRAWRAYGNISMGICLLGACVITCLLLWQSLLVFEVPEGREPTPQMILGLPGINPFIPLWYGIFGLVIAVMVHELAHGVLIMASRLKVRAVGLVLWVVPIGAFVEPDEDELKSAARKPRMRIYAAGPAANLLAALVCALLFSLVFMGSVHSARAGVGVVEVIEGTPADGILSPGMIITSFNGTETKNYREFSDALAGAHPNQEVNLTVYHGGKEHNLTLVLAEKDAYTHEEKDRGKPYLGVKSTSTSTEIYHPLGSARSLEEVPYRVISYSLLPLYGLSPIQHPYTAFYEVSGPLSALPSDTFWVLANACYWAFWLNLMVGLTNVLPAVPMDGGYLFRDWLDALLLRLGCAKARREALVDKAVSASSFLVLFLILWMLIGPRIF
ncbi:MAG: site-2 protease family protein [Candidatus Thermoplasmatota archaeon]